jgi:3-oxoacyl-(acyl-carrier-protein) synthase III
MEEQEFTIIVPMPFTGESIVDGIVIKWLVQPGNTVKKGDPLAEIETEKSAWEYESPCEGRIDTLLVSEGDVVEVKAPLLSMRTRDRNMVHLSEERLSDGKMPLEGSEEEKKRGTERVEGTKDDSQKETQKLTPKIKQLLREHSIDAGVFGSIDGSGKDGRVTADDVEAYLKHQGPEKPIGNCFIAGIGAYVPTKVIDNRNCSDYFPDIDEGYIEKVTGIQERRYLEKGSTTSDMAVAAAKRALKEAGTSAEEMDMVILATTTPDMPLPATACAVIEKLGCPKTAAFDLAAACSGWLYGLSVGKQFIQTGVYKRILVIAAEAMSRFTDRTDRATAFLFGDGAGAAVLTSGEEGGGKAHLLKDIILKADSSGYDIIYRKAGGSSYPPEADKAPGDEYWYMDGGRMFREAVSSFSDVILEVLKEANLSTSEIKRMVPHQANKRILRAVAKKTGIDYEKVFLNIHKYGNTSAASIPIALDELSRSGGVKKGDSVILCAVGAGLTSAGCLIQW